MLLETDKRGPDWAVPLAYSAAESTPFFVPKNVYVLGLMNTADRSLAVVDYALRRRFAFVNLAPEFSKPTVQGTLGGEGGHGAAQAKDHQPNDRTKRSRSQRTRRIWGPDSASGTVSL